MDNFKVLYKMLKTLEKAMDVPEFDPDLISHEKLAVSEERWNQYIQMLHDEGLIKGVGIKQWVTGDVDIDIQDIKITLKGLQFLEENSLMKKVANAAKGIVDIIK